MKRRLILPAFLLLGLLPSASAQTPGELDLSFDSGSFVNGSVNSVVPAGAAKVYIAGGFTTVRGAVRNGIARLNEDGTVDETFDPGNGASSWVKTAALQADGKVLIAGGFTEYNDVPRSHIARLNADGSLDNDFDPGSRASGPISGMAVQADNKVLIVEEFRTFSGTGSSRIVRLNADGSLDNSFDSGSGANGWVTTLALQTDGKVLITGGFTSYNGVTRNGIARLNADASLDPSFDPGNGANSSVTTVVLQTDGKVLITGEFTSYDGVFRNRVARLNADGSLDAGFDPGSGSTSKIECVVVQADGKILIGGRFTRYDGVTRRGIARLDSDGSLDTGFDPGSGPSGVVGSIGSLALQADDKVLIGGFISSLDGVVGRRIARLNSDGSQDTGFASGSGAEGNGWSNSVCVQADGKVLIGGYFTSYNGVARNRVARLNADGSLDTGFDPGSGASSSVRSVAVQADGKVLIGGWFSSYDGVTRNRIARLNGDGSLDVGFDPGTGANDRVYSVAVQADGKVLIGGRFSSYDGVTRNRIARLNADGSLDTSFDPGSGASGTVYSVAVQADGKVLIGGWFSSYDGVTRNRIARLNGDGSLDVGFDPGTGANDRVYSVAVQADGKVLIGGRFSSYDGVARNRIARLNVDGSLDTGFDPGSGAEGGAVQSVTIQSDGKVLIAGDFDSYNGVPRRGIAWLNTDGSLAIGFDPGSGVDGYYDHSVSSSIQPNASISSVALQADGKMLIGGNFTSYDGVPRSHLARTYNDPATQSLSAVDRTEVFWARGGAAPEVDRVVFDFSTDQGATWTELGAGVRAAGGWRLAGLDLPAERLLRARGFTGGGGMVEFKGDGTPLPTVTSVGSGTVPGLDEQQWIQIFGAAFADGAQVFLFDGVTEYLIPPERTVFVSESQIRVFANLTSEPAEWTVRVVNPGGFSSAALTFTVSPPMVRPLDGVDFGTVAPGESSEQTFTVRNSGETPAALTVSVAAPFSVVGASPGDLAPGGEATVTLRYAPAAAGSHEMPALFALGGQSVERSLTGRGAGEFSGGTGTVTGKVTLEDSTPVGSASVSLLRLVEGRREATGYDSRSNSLGEFSLSRVPPGDYLLVAAHRFRPRFLEKANVNVTVPQGGVVDLDIVLPPSPGSSTQSPTNLPIVLVRGRGEAGNDESAYWAALRNRLEPDFAHVWDPNEFFDPAKSFFPVINGQTGIKANAAALRSYILDKAAIYESMHGTRPPRIHLVTHSMGGLIVRQMLHDDRNQKTLPRVGDVFMLSTPNAGTLVADYAAPFTDWTQDWQTNRDLRTAHIRRTFAPSVSWPESAESGAGIRLFIAGGTRAGGLLYDVGSLIIKSHSLPGGRENDGAVPLLSSRGHWLAYRSLLDSAPTMFTSFGVPEFALLPQSVPFNHTEIKEDPAVLGWIEGILRGRLPGPISMSEGSSPKALSDETVAMSESLETVAEPTESVVAVDFRSITVSPGAAITHEVPLESVPQADFGISYSDAAISVRLIEPGGAVIDAASSVGNPAIDFETLTSEEGGMVSVSISAPTPGLWQVVLDGKDAAADAAAMIQVSCLSDLRVVPGHPERVGAYAPVPLTASLTVDEGNDLVPVLGASVAVSMTAPDSLVSSLSLADDGTQGDGGPNDGTHGLIATDPDGPGDYDLVYVVDGFHPATGEAFRRFTRGGFTRAAPGGFVVGILSHTAVDSYDNGYPDTLMLETRVDVETAGDYALSGRLLAEGHQESISAVADFSTTEGGSVAVTLLFTPQQLPEGIDIGPFSLDGLILFQRAEETSLLDVFAGGYEFPVTLHNEISRLIRVSGDLDFGEVAVGDSSQRMLTLHNDSWATLSVEKLTLPSGFSAAYEGRVDPGDAVDVEVVFVPTQEQLYQGEVVADSDAVAGSDRIPLSGEGVVFAVSVTGNGVEIQAGAANPNLGDHTDFGTVPVLDETATRTFTVSNAGTGTLALGEVSVSGDHASDFAITVQPETSVASGDATTFQVTFDPSGTGIRSAAVSFENNDSARNPFTFGIAGYGAKVAQSIVFASPGDQLANATVALSATGGGSGNPVTLSVTGPASLDGNSLTFSGAGSVTVTANQAGDDTYEAASPVAHTFTVSKAPATVTLGGLAQTYDGTPKSAGATTAPADLNLILTYGGNTSAPSAAGSYAVVGTIDDPTYQGSASGTLVIGKAAQTIAFASPGDQLANATVILSATGGGSGNAVTFSATGPASLDGDSLSFTGPGSVTVTANQAGDNNHEAATPVARTFAVTAASATVALSRLRQVADGSAREVVVTTDPPDLDFALTYDGGAEAPTVVGSYSVAAASADPRYEGSAEGTLVVDDPGRLEPAPGGSLPALSALGELEVDTFQIGAYEVTGSLWATVVAWAEAEGGYDFDGTGSAAAGDHPVAGLSWSDAAKWCNARTEWENTLFDRSLAPTYRLGGDIFRAGAPASPGDLECDFDTSGYRLPTAAEWEYAARGGSGGAPSPYPGGDTLDDLGWHAGNSDAGSQPAGAKSPNGLGLFDLAGNAAEWTWDGPSDAPAQRYLRGGAWTSAPEACELSALDGEAAAPAPAWAGLRLVRSISLAEALDQPDLLWETGGDALWFAQTATTHDGEDAAESGSLEENETSWVETVVTGPLNLSFRWRADAAEGFGTLSFTAGGEEVVSLGGENAWEEATAEIPAGDTALRWTFARGEGGGAGAGRAWLDEVDLIAVAEPQVATLPTADAVGAATATLGGEVEDDGGRAILERGLVYGTVPGPTLETAAASVSTDSGGSFEVGLSGLEPGTTYFVRAYASNNLGTGYGEEISFITLSNDANLDGLSLSAGTLSPAFAPETTAYSAVVSNATALLTVMPGAANTDATVAARINGGAYTSVASGSASGALALNVGTNTVEVRVTAEDGDIERVYAVEVFRRTYAPAPPQLFDPVGGTPLIQSPGGVNLSWAPEERANWHEIYLSKDGKLYLRQWLTGEPETDGEGNAVFNFNTAELPPGNYQWWVRSYAPVTGSGGWSAPGSFQVECEPLEPPAMPGGQTAFAGHWPLALEIEGFETSATWAQFEVLQGGASVKQLWVSLAERGRAASYDAQAGTGDSAFTILPDGDYQWRARIWSACHLHSESSTPQDLSISGTACAGSLAAPEPGQITIDLDHGFSGEAGSGNNPVVTVSPGMVPPATWYQLWIGPAGGGGPTVSKWYRYADVYDPDGGGGGSYRLEAGQYLAPGSYLAYVRGFNACSHGAWSAAKPFTVQSPASLEVTGLDVAFDGDGALRALWNGLPGVDWYQVWINSDGTNVFNRWFDGGSGGGGYLQWVEGGGQAEFRGPADSAVHAHGNYAFWVRTWLPGGTFGPWVPADGTSPVDLAAVPVLELTVEIETGRPQIRWNAATAAGGYEIYLSRNGALYHRESLLPEDLVWDEGSRTWTGSPPQEYRPYWEPEPGSYRAWVRVQGGTRFGPWSAPVDFVLP
ncbi:MAG: MBG domain-containing protein [Verrucomicrobiales bacterium]